MGTEILKGKLALVTGASSGLGVDFARELARMGCNLILLARREDQLRAVQTEISKQFSVEASLLVMDLAAPNAPQQLYEEIARQGKPVDVLINNAGFGVFGPHMEIPWEREEQMLQLDIITVAHLTKLFVKDMLARNFGYVLMVASIGSYQSSPTYAAYSAAKSFVLSLGEALSYELRKTGVGVTVVSPGVTATEFLKVAGQQTSLYQRTMMMKSSDVARIGIQSMLQRKASVVPGWMNAMVAFSNRLIPRWFSMAMAERFMTIGQKH